MSSLVSLSGCCAVEPYVLHPAPEVDDPMRHEVNPSTSESPRSQHGTSVSSSPTLRRPRDASSPTDPSRRKPQPSAEQRAKAAAVTDDASTTSTVPSIATHQKRWWTAFTSEVDVLNTILFAKNRDRAYRQHLWMRRGQRLLRLLGKLKAGTALRENQAAAESSAPHSTTRHDLVMLAVSQAGVEAANEAACDRLDTTSIALCVMACCSRFHALFSLPAPLPSAPTAEVEESGNANRDDILAMGWAIPANAVRWLRLDPAAMHELATRCCATHAFGPRQVKGDAKSPVPQGGEGEASPAGSPSSRSRRVTLGQLMESEITKTVGTRMN
jgi:hypothetical protein